MIAGREPAAKRVVRTIAAGLFGVVAWNVFRWARAGSAPNARGTVAVLIPARDEAERLPGCLETVLPQPVTEILIYDDHSRDETAAVIARYAERDRRVRRIDPLPLPAAWLGKNFGCSQLAAHATSDWLLFLDADVRLAHDAAAKIAGEAEMRGVTLLSSWPGFDTAGFWEGALMPLLNFLVFTLFSGPLSEVSDHQSLGIAHGACILVRRDVYQRLGGHGLVRSEVFEDTRLAQEWRRRGERSFCIDGQDLVRVRMYSSLPEIWRGFQKNFYPAFRHEANFWLFLGLHGLVFLLPFLWRDRPAIAFVLGARALLTRRFRQPWWSVPLHPFGEAMLIALGLSSRWSCRSGHGVTWKGRVIPGMSRPA